MRQATWYFDFVSPFAYFALHRLRVLALEARPVPVLLAGLLNHFGQKGPAEIQAKRRWTYRFCIWQAGVLGVPFRFPASHPFNPLHYLRLAIAAPQAVPRIFEHLWTTGADPVDPDCFAGLCREAGVTEEHLVAPEVKDALRMNTEAAASKGVFGVPTLEIDGELFWGMDAMDFAKAFIADAAVLHTEEMRRVDALPIGAVRRP